MHRSKLPLTVWFWAAHLMATHSNGMSAVQLEAQLGITYKTAWLLAQKLRRSMIDPQREPLEGVVEVDQTEIPFRADNSFFDPVKSGKILIAGAVEVIDRGTSQARPQAERGEISGYSVWSHPSRRHPGQLRGFDRGVCAGQREDLEPRCSPTATDRIPGSPITDTTRGRSARWPDISCCPEFIEASR